MQAEPEAGLSATARAGTLAGLALALVDVVVAGLRHPVPLAALARRSASQTAGIVLGAVLLALITRLGTAIGSRLPTRGRAPLAGLLGAFGGALVGLALFSGTGVRRLGLQLPLLLGSVAAGAFMGSISLRRKAIPSPLARVSRLAPLVSLGLYAIHATVLTRQYALAHALLGVGLVGAMIHAFGSGLRRSWSWLLAPLVALPAVLPLAASQSARSELRRAAPLGQYVARAVGLATTRSDAAPLAPAFTRHNRGPNLPLRDRDLVLVTIDALRADALRANGGRGRMPALDAMAARGVNFRAAYCATPHTSYSLTSLMLGAHARAVLALPEGPNHRQTLAQHLAAQGFTTAAFFPPAVFAVDRARFGALAEGNLGFAHAEVRYADAATVGRAAARWIRLQPRTQRLFVWLHLFEPHEPYEVHPRHDFGRDPRSRYESECASVDEALGALRTDLAAAERSFAWVITADHGEEFGEHGGAFHGTSVYVEQVRVPLVMEIPGVDARAVDAPVSLVDLAPTILAGLGISRPPRMSGDDLGPLVYALPWSRPVFAETGSLRRVVFGREALIADLDDGSLELYDLDRDPLERANLADARPERAAALRAQIAGAEIANARVDAEGTTNPEAPLPEVLTRAMQGDRALAAEIARLAADPARPATVRTRALTVLGDLNDRTEPVRATIVPITLGDNALSMEAGVTLCLLGDVRGAPGARRALGGGSPAQRRRAALGLARVQLADGLTELEGLASDARASEAERDAAVEALQGLRDARTIPLWERLLGDMRLAPRAADALGALGDRRAIAILERSLPTQRYPLTIRAILGALAALDAPGTALRVGEAMGRGDPLPDLFPLLRALDEPGRSIAGRRRISRVGARQHRAFKLLRDGTEGAWRPIRRVYLRVEAGAEGVLQVGTADPRPLVRGRNEVVIDLPVPHAARRLRVGSSVEVRVLGLAAR